ncbi:MAG: DUF512 domain-containing protein [Dehalococcoidia bacterium]|nr:DUF512 domain-containing protein [Dehalococcoidia bacterium]
MSETTAGRPKGGLISAVRGGLAARAGLQPGDVVLEIDGRPLRDVIDFQLYAAEDAFRLTLRRDGRRVNIAATRDRGEELGIEFAQPVFDAVRTCNNDCFFCFLKGLPEGMRPSLYLKDDDYRLSFYHGNFVTLTNLTESDWRRLAEQRLSPLNVSVHATDPKLRQRMLGNPRAPNVMGQLRRLAALDIRVNAQVVVCPGVNDGKHLERTISDLSALYPHVQSIGVVPVGMTRHQQPRVASGETPVIAPCTPPYAAALLAQVRRRQREFRRRLGADLVYAADELYLLARRPFPAASRYDGFPQYHNGIGMTRALIDDWRRLRRKLRRAPLEPNARSALLACGTLIAPVIQKIAAGLATATGVDMRVRPVESEFWGPRVTVSGLLTASDFIRGLRDAPCADAVFLPRASLDHAGERFLDGGTPDDLRDALDAPVVFVDNATELARCLTSPLE